MLHNNLRTKYIYDCSSCNESCFPLYRTRPANYGFSQIYSACLTTAISTATSAATITVTLHHRRLCQRRHRCRMLKLCSRRKWIVCQHNYLESIKPSDKTVPVYTYILIVLIASTLSISVWNHLRELYSSIEL